MGYIQGLSRITYMSDLIAHLSEATFEETIQSADKPVLVDFWAEWCGPCKAIAPILEEIADEHQEILSIAKLNVDDVPQIAQRFEVMSIPTLILFEDGQQSKRLIGASSKADLLEKLEIN